MFCRNDGHNNLLPANAFEHVLAGGEKNIVHFVGRFVYLRAIDYTVDHIFVLFPFDNILTNLGHFLLK